ncbi:hypothetical protein BME24068_02912 [Burkholderia metallica]|nr:hypothetical protein BME24068_02912 [Burkholderia metallica]
MIFPSSSGRQRVSAQQLDEAVCHYTDPLAQRIPFMNTWAAHVTNDMQKLSSNARQRAPEPMASRTS